MGVRDHAWKPRNCPGPCGIVYDPLTESCVDLCQNCEATIAEGEPVDEEALGSPGWSMHKCGLIPDYFL